MRISDLPLAERNQAMLARDRGRAEAYRRAQRRPHSLWQRFVDWVRSR